jgi:enoyl-CoA hydratase/carnithine racemase
MAQKSFKKSFPLETVAKFLGITKEDLKLDVFTKQKDSVFYMVMNTKANTFNQNFVRKIHDELDKVEANQGATALVTLGFSDKFFSPGLDL